MNRLTNPNLAIVEMAAELLGDLTDRLVFLGGCATGLLLTDVAAPPVRYTHDVDVITEVASTTAYYHMAEELRIRGFREDSSDNAPICRWKAGMIVLDVMPTTQEVLGFANIWYQAAFASASYLSLPSGRRIRMITAPYFLACKFAAFDNRGEGDYLMSHDIEDIVAVIDGRPELIDEIRLATEPLRSHLAERFGVLLKAARFREALPGLLPADRASQARLPFIIERMKLVAAFGPG